MLRGFRAIAYSHYRYKHIQEKAEEVSVRAVLVVLAGTVVLAFVAAAAFIGSGIYNFAADSPHTAIVAKLVGWARERSVELRSDGIRAPPLNNSAMIREGAEHYDAMCTGCHLAPGMAENEMRRGLNPKPPALASLPPEEPAEQFWIVKHGLKMTAMPAWGLTHSDEEIWNVVAFLQKLPRLSPAQYRMLVAESGKHHDRMDMSH
jgi:mono/diheme cytochrome c family protein